jgi:hypothetical protein
MRHKSLLRVVVLYPMHNPCRDMHAIPRTQPVHSAFQKKAPAAFHHHHRLAVFVKMVGQARPGRECRGPGAESRGPTLL